MALWVIQCLAFWVIQCVQLTGSVGSSVCQCVPVNGFVDNSVYVSYASDCGYVIQCVFLYGHEQALWVFGGVCYCQTEQDYILVFL